MMKDKALEFFTAVPRLHNCAQAVACGCGHCELKDQLASCGGGRAPEGVCGALYAAGLVVGEENREKVYQDFISENGSSLCRELKANSVPCPKCVETAAALAEKYGVVTR